MAELFFLLSGEHPTLPFSELKAILEAEGHKYRILETLTQVLRIDSSVDSVKSVNSRSAMTRVCCLELFSCNVVFAEILENLRSAFLEGFIEQGESFAVRVRRIRGATPHLVGVELERKLGELILNKVKKTRVDLAAPQKTFFGVLTDNRFLFGLKMAEISPKPFVERRPRKRPFFHPTAMPAKLARCMVNLAQPKGGDLVLDPFCGTASILVEAWLIGCRVVGFDVQPHMARGSLQNLLHYGVKPEGIAVADARHPPVAKVDCIVTDPPYGRSATTLGWSTRQIVEDFLSTIEDLLPKGRRICMASPKSVRIGKIGRELGLKHIESHFVYVHRSLTREIAVFKKS
ncbi:MAG: tRNA (guanine(10)-N2)-dimethyltransferase [Candidatus Bathyarchaeota archaeon BA2]|nr:MAG: tRNA (guanine(10)-N2)-dimethyltransferase [Candidatus Bathyarchaeota archaeon BA2]